ncbi:uncharacterized protein LOC126779898 isoform X2 [Nymphalis io]|uniref:uncharacterized protein LOC126779898 isoform X2 n=1 Tax=Inachis io TaxID=171585 RepID=UPI00216886D5|nr:uncharacterized protein LOC126779898 isoform X2 [Nymphalis io]
MGSVNIDCDTKRELDDSGCIQDDFIVNGFNQIGLLDLSDDVLLYILRYCSPRDLKALGFSCVRLGRLVRERSLWRRVDASSVPCSEARLKWLLDNALHQDTRVLMLSGYARNADGCLGLLNVTRKEASEEKDESVETEAEQIHEIPIPVHLERHHARLFISAQRTPNMPRYRGFPSWSDESNMGRSGPQRCNGPQFSFSQQLLQQLVSSCTQLTTLAVDYCNIDCNRTNLGHFPKMLKKLSLRGTRCYNMPTDKSFLFKIQEHLPILESLNVSECEWMDPATLLPLSKMPKLEELFMRDCPKLAEFVAYASLTSRYGFRTLRSLDLRGSPVGDSEVSALGWLPNLENLWLAARRRHAGRFKRHHAHYADDPPVQHDQLDDWEQQEPDYFKSKSVPDTSVEDPETDDVQPSGSQTEPAVESQTETQTSATFNTNTERDKEGTSKRKPEDGSGDSAVINGESPLNKRQKIDNVSNESNDTTNTSNNSHTKGDSNGTNGNGQSQNNETKSDDYPKNRIMKINCEINVNVIGVIETDSDDPDVMNDEEADNRYENQPVNGDSRNDENGNDDNNPLSVPNLNAQANENARNENFRMQNQRGGSPDCIVDCIKIDQLIDVGELRCGRQNEVIVIASTSRAKLNSRQDDGYVHFRNQEPVPAEENATAKAENEAKSKNEEDTADAGPKQTLKRPNENVNEGASTSKEGEKSEEPKEKYVCFRKNQEPVYVNCTPENQANQNQQNQRREPLPPIQYQIEPRHHVLYVSVGPQLNTYRFPRDSSELDRHLNLNFRSTHVDSSSLVTDFAMRRFGRADGEDVNIIHIGPNGPMVVGHDTGSRPDRSNLRFLSVTGYRNITDRSLVHLATAAPNLTRIDFTDTNVSENGAENFRGIRPDCELTFSKYTDNID